MTMRTAECTKKATKTINCTRIAHRRTGQNGEAPPASHYDVLPAADADHHKAGEDAEVSHRVDEEGRENDHDRRSTPGPPRSPGLARDSNLHQKSAPETDSKDLGRVFGKKQIAGYMEGMDLGVGEVCLWDAPV